MSLEAKVVKIISDFRFEVGNISSHLIEIDPSYRERVVELAKEDLCQRILNELRLDAKFFEVEEDKPRIDMPSFDLVKKKYLHFIFR